MTGTNTAEIKLLTVAAQKNGHMFRCRVSRDQCVVFSDPALLLVDPVYSLPEPATYGKTLSVFPNPACNDINAEICLPGAGLLEMELYSSNGEKYINVKENICCHGKHDFKFNVVYLPIGLYLFRYRFAGSDQYQSGTCKIILSGE